MLSLLKLGILFLAFLSVFVGSLIFGVSQMIHDARSRQHHVIQQQIDDSHALRNWRMK